MSIIGKFVKKSLRDEESPIRKEEKGMDVTPIFLDPQLSRAVTEALVNNARRLRIDAVCGVESRGGKLGPIIAQKLDLPYIMLRDEQNIRGNTLTVSYEKENGKSTRLGLRINDLKEGNRVLIHGDTLSSGRTVEAASELLEKRRCKVAGYSFIAHLAYLGGVNRLINYSRNIFALAVFGKKKEEQGSRG